MKVMKKILSGLLSLTMAFGVSAATAAVLDSSGITQVSAAGMSVNATDVKIYMLYDWEEEFISIPSDLPQSFQIRVSGTSSDVTYSVSGGSYLQVSETGLITPLYQTTYWYNNGSFSVGYSYPIEGQEPSKVSRSISPGKYTVKVKSGGETADINVELVEYGNIYCQRVMDDYVKDNITASMTTEQKLDKIGQFVAARNYDRYYSSAQGLIVAGGGDCWASTDAVITLAEKCGLTAWARNGNRDPGAGSGHMNAMVTDGKPYYEVEAGYVGTAPRGYDITKRTSMFSVKYNSTYEGYEVYQYDGQTMPTHVYVPSEINGKTIVSIGDSFLERQSNVEKVTLPNTIKHIGKSAFNSCTNLKSFTIPPSVIQIDTFAFTCCDSLTSISASGLYTYKNGAIYKNSKILVSAPCAENVTILPGTTEIEEYAFYYNKNIKSLTIPANVKTIGEGAFGDCSNLQSITFEGTGLSKLGDFVFADDQKLPYVILPASVTEIGDNINYLCS